MTDRTASIRALNDELRQSGAGGRIMLTAGVAALPPESTAAIVAAVQHFDGFSADNDPHGEHDFGMVEAAGLRLFFKIDYYDTSLTSHSDDAANPAVTVRVLTIMLASEY